MITAIVGLIRELLKEERAALSRVAKGDPPTTKY